MKGKRVLIILGTALIVLLSMEIAQAQWLDPAWKFRTPVNVSNSSVVDLIDFQVQVNLDSSFDFTKALSDGSDLRVTDSGGVTKIPFWIEAWTPPSASIWVKVPSIPMAGTTIYLYYGNPTPPGPALVDVPPTALWQKNTNNPIRPIGDPIGDPNRGNNLLSENMVYDEDTGHYWLVFANYRTSPYSVCLAWSDNPTDPTAWNWYAGNPVITAANAPHILKYNGTWYIFYADNSHGWPFGIAVSTSESITGPYTGATSPYTDRIEVLAAAASQADYCKTGGGDWDGARVDEPYVFQRSDGKWILVYMGDKWGYTTNCSISPGVTEQNGYAIADDILGPYTKYSGNPIIPFGPPGTFDSGTVADPWVYEFNGTYYIGYVGAPNKAGVPADTAYVTTTDWVNFTKHPINLPVGPTGSWDVNRAFRGGVSRVGDTYILPYTGLGADGIHRMGIATQPAKLPEPINDPDKVFEFFDSFGGTSLNLSKWIVNNQGPGGTVPVAGGSLTLRQPITPAGSYVQIRATTPISINTLLEGYASHPDAQLDLTAGEVGYKGADITSFSNLIRIWNARPNINSYIVSASSAGTNSGDVSSNLLLATYPPSGWRVYRIYRTDSGTAEFEIDSSQFYSLSGAYVPTIALYPWLMSYAKNPAAGSPAPATQSRFAVDWIRVRKWYGEDLPAVIGSRESNVRGDLNNDGCVAMADYNLLMAYIRALGPYNSAYDINGDGKVNIADARYLVTLFTNPRGAPCN